MNANTTTKPSRLVTFAKTIVKVYFVIGLAFSYSHFLHAAGKVDLHGLGAHSMPILIDGMALFGMVLRSRQFSKGTNKLGLWLQLVCGTLSLSVNIFAGDSIGQSVQGAAWVMAYMVLELFASRIKPASADTDAENQRAADEAQAIVDAANAWMSACSHPTKCTSAAQCAAKTAATTKRSKTLARKARVVAQQNKALDSLINA